MSDIVQANYDLLGMIAGNFQAQSEANAQMLQSILAAMHRLESGDWIGRGSDAFFAEMKGEVLPAVQRLIQALSQAHQTTNEISQFLEQADEEAASGFRRALADGADSDQGIGNRIGRGEGALGFGRDAGRGNGEGGLGSGSGVGSGEGRVGVRNGPGNGGGSIGDIGTTFPGNGFGNRMGGGGFGGGYGGGFGESGLGGYGGFGFSSNSMSVPSNWLSGVRDSLGGSLNDYLGSNYNDYGIPRDWLSGVRDAFGRSGIDGDYGIPRDWLSQVRDAFADPFGDLNQTAADERSSGGGSGGGGAQEEATTPDESREEAPLPNAGGGSSSPQSQVNRPFGNGGFAGNTFTSGVATSVDRGESEPTRVQYQSATGGPTPSPTSTATDSHTRTVVQGGSAATTPASSGSAFPIGIAAVSPFLALLGKALKKKTDDEQ